MTAIQFLDLLERSQLVKPEKLRTFLSVATEGSELASQMAQVGLITEWQADKLLEGKFKGFRLGEYTLLRYLARTPVSQDYVAEHRQTKRQVIVSVSPLGEAHNATFRNHYRREVSEGKLHLDQDGKVYFVVRPYNGGV